MTDVTTVIVRIEHVRAELLCVTMTRVWCRDRGLDFAAFLENGIPADELEAMDDWFAKRVAARARREAVNGRG
ncbi:hypothetical protein [Lysobacter sp. CA199]|uniref:hypothetical protein n=1 Tax=Lysobacter sp. CA199 TaxID=3455608 RepID=UPI003F8D0E2C